MATFLPQQTTLRPLPDFLPSSPPDQAIFNNRAQQTKSTQNATAESIRHRQSADFTANGTAYTNGNGNGNGAMPVPNGPSHHIPNGGSRHRGTMSLGAFDGPRTPPNTKNTSHVPCKFFRSGQCQAGKACPFSHSTDVSTVDTPCKYFAKGNCKFGAKCALVHILPNGIRVNRPNGPVGGQLNLGGRVDPQLYQQSDPALAHSLLAQQANGAPLPFGHQIPAYAENEYAIQQKLHDNVPMIDTGYTSRHDSTYGSPRDDSRLPMSPVAHLSARDAPMPASFDSQGISYIARHGAVAASVPSKFGLESPPGSLPKKGALPTDAVRNLHSSVYPREARAKGPDLGSSPLGSGDEGFGQRIMHSKRVNRPGMMSASLPRSRGHVSGDWDDDSISGEGEDRLPISLDELLSPQEKLRRLSRTEKEPKIIRDNLSGLGNPVDSPSKVGSPGTGSPSRYGAFFASQKQDEGSNNAASVFGHVGSPLRNSSLHSLASPPLRATKVPGDTSPAFASPPRQSSMSIISQQVARARISSHTADSNDNATPFSNHNSSLPPGMIRHASLSSNPTNRVLSSSSAGGTGRIAEEQGDCAMFLMEEEDDDHRKRYSGNVWSYNPPKPSPRLGAIGSGRGGGVEGKDYWNGVP